MGRTSLKTCLVFGASLILSGCLSWKQPTPHTVSENYCGFVRHELVIGGHSEPDTNVSQLRPVSAPAPFSVPAPVAMRMSAASDSSANDPCSDSLNSFQSGVLCALNNPVQPPMPVVPPITPPSVPPGIPGPYPPSPPPPVVLPPRFEPEPKAPPMLFLSGGNLNGAFGAGFLEGWAETRGVLRAEQTRGPYETGPFIKAKYALPDFSVVTGVSTGAILSLSAYANVPEAAREGYDIEGEHEVLDVNVSPRGKTTPIRDMIKTLNNGAATDLKPMRDSLIRVVDDYGLLNRIAAKTARDNSKLYVGVVDLDTGGAYALDMTDMATRIMYEKTQTFNTEKETLYRNCFFDAIVASSAVPLAARPVSIDNRLYIDGGARFLVFTNQVGPILENNPNRKFKADGTPQEQDVFTIINGDQTLEPVCKKKDPLDCYGNGQSGFEGARKDWTLLDVALRAVDVLSAQVKEYSEFDVETQAGQQAGANYDSIKLETSFLNHLYYEPPSATNGLLSGTMKSCADWLAYEKETSDAQKFHQIYMRCLIDLGRLKAAEKNWN